MTCNLQCSVPYSSLPVLAAQTQDRRALYSFNHCHLFHTHCFCHEGDQLSARICLLRPALDHKGYTFTCSEDSKLARLPGAQTVSDIDLVHQMSSAHEVTRSLLVGVPTNAQLTLTLLRIGEANKSPLPPPPTSQEDTAPDAEDETSSFDASEYDVDSDSEEYPTSEHTLDNGPEGGETPKRKPGRKIAAALKRTVKAGVGGALSVDHLKAKMGSEHAKQRLGAISEPPPSGTIEENTEKTEKVARISLPGGEGPSVFSGRLHGKRGHALIVNSATSPCLAFAYTKVSKGLLKSLLPGSKDKSEVDIDIHPEFSIGLADIMEMRKMGGFGWKTKMVVGWALSRQVLDGLEIVDRQGNHHVLTAIKGRDELFNRLIAMGKHKWESL